MDRLVAGIIADDLTGALDTAAPFAARGLRTVAAVSPDALPAALAAGPEVISVNLSSRELGEAEAGVRAASVAASTDVPFARLPVMLKKVDSRLKGHVGAELAAIVDATGPARIVVCPAVPELGRIVRNGRLEGMGVTTPIPVAERIGRGLGRPVEIADAESDEDLDDIVASRPPGTLFVGARGLGSALARRLARKRDDNARAAASYRGPMAFVVGSRDPITRAQVDLLLDIGGVVRFDAPDGRAGTITASGPFVLLATAGADPEAKGTEVAARLASAVASIDRNAFPTLLLTGGETAAAVFAEAGTGALEILGEALPGLPLCRPANDGAAALVITKSGGFGDRDCLVTLLRNTSNRT